MKKRIAALTLAAAMTLGLTACGGGGGSQPSSAPSGAGGSDGQGGGDGVSAAILLPGTINDAGWSAAGYNGLMQAKDEYGLAAADYSESVPLAEQESTIRDYASRGYNLIIGHGNDFLDAIKSVSAEFPDTAFAVTNSVVEGYDNVVGIDVKNEEQGYVAGYALGLLTQSNKVGFVGSTEGLAQKRVENGFVQGLAASNPSAQPVITYVGSMDDSAKAKEQANALFNEGVDCIFQYAQGAGIGVVQAAEESGKTIVVTSPSQQEMAPNTAAMYVQTDTKQQIVSAVKAYTEGNFNSSLKIEGTFASGLFKVGGYSDSLMSSDVQSQVQKVVDDLTSGAIQLEVTAAS